MLPFSTGFIPAGEEERGSGREGLERGIMCLEGVTAEAAGVSGGFGWGRAIFFRRFRLALDMLRLLGVTAAAERGTVVPSFSTSLSCPPPPPLPRRQTRPIPMHQPHLPPHAIHGGEGKTQAVLLL